MRISLLAAAACGLVTVSCGHPSSGGSGGSTGTGGASNCTPGEELCSCMSGNACNPGLACADDINKCVTVNGSGSGGTTTATGGSPGSGGSTGSGGVVGSGGTNATGGSSASGGATGTGGSSATGGSMGTGGGPAGPNLIMNGDFSQNTTGWNIQNGSSQVTNGQLCVQVNGSQAIIGWGDATASINVTSGKTYSLSYQASATNPVNLAIHLGSTQPNYDLDAAEISGDKPTSSLQTFMHDDVSAMRTDSQAGLAFLVTAMNGSSTFCLDNVSLTQK
ncbi:MAG TPA: carbohydrate binding domain-containing protein [Polyangia bacterium]|nr:carbohydrate binding domain-containing protein [Polyangia bacterium]